MKYTDSEQVHTNPHACTCTEAYFKTKKQIAAFMSTPHNSFQNHHQAHTDWKAKFHIDRTYLVQQGTIWQKL